jgi:hypothetical protein
MPDVALDPWGQRADCVHVVRAVSEVEAVAVVDAVAVDEQRFGAITGAGPSKPPGCGGS